MAQSFQNHSKHVKANEPNHPAAGKAGITRLLTTEHYCPGLPEPGRSAEQ